MRRMAKRERGNTEGRKESWSGGGYSENEAMEEWGCGEEWRRGRGVMGNDRPGESTMEGEAG